MLAESRAEAESTCPIPMDGKQPCGRPIYCAPAGVDSKPVCLMHSRDLNKDKAQYWGEIEAILGGKSTHHQPKTLFDFTRFVFPGVDLEGERFGQRTVFARATFTQSANFSATIFAGDADFDGAIFACPVSFYRAQFKRKTRFHHATFEKKAMFQDAKFCEEVNFESATFNEKSDFCGVTFSRQAYFYRVMLNQDASFGFATFMQDAVFFMATFMHNADFWGAKFDRDATFSGATFTRNADFVQATFCQHALFSRTIFGPRARNGGAPAPNNLVPAIADFSRVRFEKPTLVRFYQVNKDSPQGLRARFLNCEVEGIHFVDVNWHKQGDRMVLQDELDITEPLQPREQAQKQAEEKNTKPEAHYELVAVAYRQLVNNFDKMRAYELAEDCFVGAMEMKRLKPAQPWFSHSVVTLYRWASNYGSNYVRAMAVLGILLLAFGLLFAILWAGLHVKGVPQTTGSSWVLETARMVARGLFHSFEIATFQRDTIYVTTTLFGRFLGILEIVLVPSELALLLLALRRRFRR